MPPGLDLRDLGVTYHALGHNVDEGLVGFDDEFRDAEAEYRLEDVKALLEVIQDRTLQDGRLIQWYHYYAARGALMLWQIDVALDHLDRIQEPLEFERDRDRLKPRLQLLRGQIAVMQGQWAAGRDRLKTALSAFQASGEATLQADAYESMAQAYLSQAQSVGSWAKPESTRSARIRWLLAQGSLLPVLALLFLVLRMWQLQFFFGPAVRFSADFTNWPIFRYYLYAYWAMRHARRLADEADPERRFRLDLMHAEILRSLTAYDAAHRAYRNLETAWAAQGSAYQKALIDHGQARVLMEMQTAAPAEHAARIADPRALLERARETYEKYGDERAMAHVDLLLGDLAWAENEACRALNMWASSIETAKAKNEALGLADGLGRCYAMLEARPATDVVQALNELIGGVAKKAFSARLPNRLFRALRWAVWLAPLLAVLAGVLLLRIWLGAHERSDYRILAALVFSWRGLVGAVAMMLLVMAANSALGLIGLMTTLFVPATRLDTFVIDDDKLKQIDATGETVQSVAWSEVTAHLRVQRAVWAQPTPSLSFDYLCSRVGPPVVLPATTRWFEHLQGEIDEHTGQGAQDYSLKAYGGLAVLQLALAFPIAFVILDLAFYPALSIDVHAISAAVCMLISFLTAVWTTHRWIAHYVRVYRRTSSLRAFQIGVCAVGVLLVVVSFVFEGALYPLQALPAAWGVSVLVAWVGEVVGSRVSAHQWRVKRVAQGVVLVCGLALLSQQVAPALLHLAAFTYSGAVQKLDQSEPDEAADRSLSFQRLAALSRQMLALDSSYTVAHGLLGIAEQGQGNYAAAIEAYAEYLERSNSGELYDCRALCYLELGQEEQARADFTSYGKPCDSVEEHYCDRYFPGTRLAFCRR
jgi:hypothetical protein